MNFLNDVFSGQWGAFALVSPACLLIAVGLFRHARDVTVSRRWVLGSAAVLAIVGVILLPPSIWSLWIETEPGHGWYIDQLVGHGNIERAVELAGRRKTWSVLEKSMQQHKYKDYRPLLDRNLHGPDILLFFESQIVADPEIAIDFAFAQSDFTLRKLLLQRILNGHGRRDFSAEYLIDHRPEIFAEFLEIGGDLNSGGRFAEDRAYSCALHSAMRRDRIELAQLLLTHVHNSMWVADISSALGKTLWQAGDIEAARRTFRQGISAADECADPHQSLWGMHMVAGGFLAMAGLEEVRESLSAARNLRDNLDRSAQSRKSMDDTRTWASYLADELCMWGMLGGPEEVARTEREAHEFIDSLADAERKERLLDAWGQLNKPAPEVGTKNRNSSVP